MIYTTEIRNAIIEQHIVQMKPVSQLSFENSIPRSTIYAWIKKYKEADKTRIATVAKKSPKQLEQKIVRLENIIKVLKTCECSVDAPLIDRLNAIEKMQNQYSVHILCEALNVPRGTYYNHIYRNKRDNTWYAVRREELREKIQRIYDDSRQIFGPAKIAAVLRSEGTKASNEYVRTLMQDMGLASIRQDAKRMYDKETAKYKNYLNQQFRTDAPNQVWVSDVTQYRFKNKNYYICAIIDLFARRVVGYMISKRNSTLLVKMTFKHAYETRKPVLPLIFHTDRGSNYRSNSFCTFLQELGVTQSFSRAHVPYDNSVMESFFSTLKKEELYRMKYKSEREFREAVDTYIQFYNDRRPHAKLQNKTPNQKEAEYAANTEKSKK